MNIGIEQKIIPVNIGKRNKMDKLNKIKEIFNISCKNCKHNFTHKTYSGTYNICIKTFKKNEYIKFKPRNNACKYWESK